MSKKLTTEEFIERSRTIHGKKYDYSKVIYKNNCTKVIINCPTHGDFSMRPADHLNGQGCPKCKGEVLSEKFSMGLKKFLEKANSVHHGKYDYGKTEYVNNRTKVCIICPEHGEFWQTPDKHLFGQGCPKCCKKNRKYSTEEFVEKSRSVHGTKYDYSKTVYGANDKEKVCIICPEHGEFWQTPLEHLNGCGCKYCRKGKVFNTDDFISESNKVHNSKYNYSKTIYKKSLDKVCIICPEHGEFWQAPSKHLGGCGCPICSKKYRKGELFLFEYLKEHIETVNFIHSYRNKQIFGKQEIDIYIPEYKIGIEFQGKQHFNPVDFGGYGKNKSEEIFSENRKRDLKKNKLCRENGIDLLYFSDMEEDLFLGEKVFHNHEEICRVIKRKIDGKQKEPISCIR